MESWVMKTCIGRILGGFHHRVARRLTGRQPWRVRVGRWVYPLLTEAMYKVELQEVETYISRHQNIVSQFNATRPIMDLCLVAERRLGSQVSKRWWEQEVLEWEGMWTAVRRRNRRRGRRICTERQQRQTNEVGG